MWIEALVAVAALLLSFTLTGMLRSRALSQGVGLDVPNERSSHTVPTPRGGGIAIVVAASAGFAVMAACNLLSPVLFLVLVIGGSAIAAVGFFDDRRHLSARTRLAVHFAVALCALIALGGLPSLRMADDVVLLDGVGYPLGVLGIVWTINLFNFMDGIDGIAASESICVAWGGAVLAVIAGVSADVSAAGFIFGAACCGFLLWNWAPAKIFMGDVGSGYMGYVIAILAIATARENPIALYLWAMLGGIFFVDATLTLVRRLLRRERVYEAHRSHAYQWLARRWASHRRVTLVVIGVNLFWLLPCALLAQSHPESAVTILLAAFAPLVVAAVAAGAGRAESR